MEFLIVTALLSLLSAAAPVLPSNPASYARPRHLGGLARIPAAYLKLRTGTPTPTCRPMSWNTKADGSGLTVCRGAMVRQGSHAVLQGMRQCDVIDGNLVLAHMGVLDSVPWSAYSLPLLREITGHLFLYNVHGLPTLASLLPALAVVRGQQLVGDYSVVVSSTGLKNLGLASLQAILRGSVFVSDNFQLEYLDTLDFGYLHPATPGGGHGDGIQEEKTADGRSSHRSCPTTCTAGAGPAARCWSHTHCQTVCRNCTGGCAGTPRETGDSNGIPSVNQWSTHRRNAELGATRTHDATLPAGTQCCDHSCVGGCQTYDGVTRCNACRHFLKHSSCVRRCSATDYKYKNYFCISSAQCRQLLNHKLFSPAAGARHCVQQCPPGYAVDAVGANCVQCAEHKCDQRCPGIVVNHIADLQSLRGCSHIVGSLTISLSNKRILTEDLDDGLRGIVHISQFLVVDHSTALVSLRHLRSLRSIGGQRRYRGLYSLYVNGNEHLKELWPEDHKLAINGSVVFVSNPRLCAGLITDLVTANSLDLALPADLVTVLNGGLAKCNDRISNFQATASRDGSVQLSWTEVAEATEIGFEGFYVYFMVTEDTDLQNHRDTYVCNSKWLSHYFVRPNEQTYTLKGVLKPFTRFAMYLETVGVGRGAFSSDMVYVTTAVSRPSAPRNVQRMYHDSKSLEVAWRPPAAPNGRVDYYRVTYTRLQTAEEDTVEGGCGTDAEFYSTAPEIRHVKLTNAKNNSAEEGLCNCLVSSTRPSGHQTSAIEDLDNLLNSYLRSDESQKMFLETTHCADKFSANALPRWARHRRQAGDGAGGAGVAVKTVWRSHATDAAPGSTLQNSDAAHYSDKDVDASAPEDIKYDLVTESDEGITVTVRGDTQHVVLTQLRHYSPYSVQVAACNCINENATVADCDGLCSTESGIINIFHTSPDAAADRVRDVTVSLLDEGIVVVTWVPPPHPNGRLLSYLLEIINRNYSTYRECILRSQHSFQSPHPLPEGSYKVKISSRTSGGVTGAVYSSSFTVEAGPSVWPWLVGATLAVLVVASVAAAAIWRRCKTAKKLLVAGSAAEDTYRKWLWSIDPVHIHERKDLQLEESHFGSGNFGVVTRGNLQLKCGAQIKVAVKQLKDTNLKSTAIMQEAKIMLALRSAYIVRAFGVVVESSGVLLVLELMTGGNLHDFLCSHRTPDNDIFSRLNTAQVVGMALQVADGMNYLTAHKIVHRDLASRNCLLDHQQLNVKISDFGLSRPIENDSRGYYQLLDCSRKIPVRSMPPEFFLRGIYGFQSDVWSYGVLLWEILSAGATPYGEHSDTQVEHLVRSGVTLRSSVPGSCPHFLKEVLLSCWQFQQKHRPRFGSIIAALMPSMTILDTGGMHFVRRFRQKAFYYTDEGCEYNSRKWNIMEGRLRNTGTRLALPIPPAPKIPLPPLPSDYASCRLAKRPTTLPSYRLAKRPTTLPILPTESGYSGNIHPVHSSLCIFSSLGHTGAEESQLSPNITSPTSTVSTLLSPAPTFDAGNRANGALGNCSGFMDTIKRQSGFATAYGKMKLIKTGDEQIQTYISSFSEPNEGIESNDEYAIDIIETDCIIVTDECSIRNENGRNEDPGLKIALLQEQLYEDMRDESIAANGLLLNETMNDHFTDNFGLAMGKSSSLSSLTASASANSDCLAHRSSSSCSTVDLSNAQRDDEETDGYGITHISQLHNSYPSDRYQSYMHNTSIGSIQLETPPPSRNNSLASNQSTERPNLVGVWEQTAVLK